MFGTPVPCVSSSPGGMVIFGRALSDKMTDTSFKTNSLLWCVDVKQWFGGSINSEGGYRRLECVQHSTVNATTPP